jgi:hypothetical protein
LFAQARDHHLVLNPGCNYILVSMKAEIIGTAILLVIFILLFYLGGLGIFWFRVWGATFMIFGFLLTFALGDIISGMSGGAIKFGLILFVSGLLMLIGSALI